MRRTRVLVHARLLGMLVLGLAAPAALADQGKCEADCASSAGLEMQSCLERCPEARDPTKASSFQACALRCKNKFEQSMSNCADRCPTKEGKDAPAKRKRSRN
ncbi:hypothetical protein [Hyalangium gracile]|uniref:hypothetical protein n=1 Tax=Hyalangium gracile TaxID=394092 RepID=UPI001CCD17ED|nr:hypothetical protein [Hyalangium gracile]